MSVPPIEMTLIGMRRYRCEVESDGDVDNPQLSTIFVKLRPHTKAATVPCECSFLFSGIIVNTKRSTIAAEKYKQYSLYCRLVEKKMMFKKR